jgi:hypothetical protein
MADRYWVGGSGTWNTSSTTNWSATSGGASGASVPTASDNVIFNSATTYTVTLTGALTCLDFTVSAGTVTFTSTGTPTISGSMSLVAGTVWSASGAITFNATTTGKTVTTNGVSIAGRFVFDGVGGGWTLGSALTSTNTSASTAGVIWTNGTFNTGNFNITTASSPSFATATGTKTVNLGSSTLTGAYASGPGGDFIYFGGSAGDAGLTLNAGTSTLTSSTGGTSSFYGSGKTFYNVNLRTATTYLTGTNIDGANTFNNLTIYGSSSNTYNIVTLYANQTINGTLSLGSTSQTAAQGGAPMHVKSSGGNSGTTYTLTAAAVSLLGVTFQNITAAGAAAPFTGTNIGNAGGNTNITATASKTVYWSLAAGGTWQVGTSGSIAFATSSGRRSSTHQSAACSRHCDHRQHRADHGQHNYHFP